MALVSGISLDPEAAIGVTKRSPPKWVDGVDEVSGMLVARDPIFLSNGMTPTRVKVLLP